MKIVEKINIPTFSDERGDLSVMELKNFIDWEVKRIYYATSTKKMRGGHAFIGEKKLYVCAQGSMVGKFHDGESWQEIALNGPGEGVQVGGLCWREFDGFSEGAVLLCVSNLNYESEKYITEFGQFLEYYQSKK